MGFRELLQLRGRLRSKAGLATLGAVGALLMFGAGEASAAPGAPVTTFGTNGSVTHAFGPASTPESIGQGVAIAPNGDIYQVGSAYLSTSGSSTELYIARYLPSGALDKTFGTGGVVYENVGAGATPETAMAVGEFTASTFVALTPQGNPVVFTPTTTSTSVTQVAVLEFTQSGALNTAFNGSGVVTFSLGATMTPGGLAVQSNGDIVVTGSVETGGGEFFAVRLISSGAPDASFGTGGLEELPGVLGGFGVVVQGNGDLVFGGAVGSGAAEIGVVRLTPNGQPDPTFGTAGVATASPPGAGVESEGLGVTATPNGGYAVPGVAIVPPAPPAAASIDAAVAEFSASGQPASGFGTGGVSILNSSSLEGIATGVFPQAGGQTVVTGLGLGGVVGEPFVALLDSSGALVGSYGENGFAIPLVGGVPLSATMTSGTTLLLSGEGESLGAGVASVLSELTVDTPPVVSLAYAPTSVGVGSPVQFFASAQGDGGLAVPQVSWDFGSGSFGAATGASVSHTFTAPGTYTVRVQATDSFGLSTIASQTITVVGPSVTVGGIKPANGGVQLQIACNGATCDVTATLTTMEHLHRHRVARLSAGGHGKHLKMVEIGSAKLQIGAGQTEPVILDLNRLGKRLLRRFHSIPATATFELTNGGNTMLHRTVRIH